MTLLRCEVGQILKKKCQNLKKVGKSSIGKCEFLKNNRIQHKHLNLEQSNAINLQLDILAFILTTSDNF